MSDDLKYRLALHFLPGIGPISARALISYCGSIENIFSMKKAHLERIPGIGRERASMIQKKEIFERVENEMLFMEKNKIRAIYYLDDDYPARLKNCEDAPLMIFYKGEANLNHSRMVAIVGTRFMTPYGKDLTEELVQELSKHGVSIVSGLAYGVDVQAHKSALKHGMPTIGVIAHGFDQMYPSENRATAEKMMHEGGIVSEYPSMTKLDRNNFPARNRIVAGMCDAVVVIESAEKGGALITAELANDYNREVFALPGRVRDNFSKGCHKLIRENKAMLIENGFQLVEMMQWDAEKKNESVSRQLDLFNSLTEEELKIVGILKDNSTMQIDALALHSEIAPWKLSSLLLQMEFAGILRTLPGKCYELV